MCPLREQQDFLVGKRRLIPALAAVAELLRMLFSSLVLSY